MKPALSIVERVGYVVNFSRGRLQFKRFVLQNDFKKYKPG